MKTKLKISALPLLCLIALLECSCNGRSTPMIVDTDNKVDSFDILIIKINGRRMFSIYKNQDTLRVSDRRIDSTTKPGSYLYSYLDTKKISSRSMTDSLASISREILRTAPRTEQGNATDYVGDYFEIIIGKGATKSSVSFDNVSDWESISPSTEKLDSLLQANHLLDSM